MGRNIHMIHYMSVHSHRLRNRTGICLVICRLVISCRGQRPFRTLKNTNGRVSHGWHWGCKNLIAACAIDLAVRAVPGPSVRTVRSPWLKISEAGLIKPAIPFDIVNLFRRYSRIFTSSPRYSLGIRGA